MTRTLGGNASVGICAMSGTQCVRNPASVAEVNPGSESSNAHVIDGTVPGAATARM